MYGRSSGRSRGGKRRFERTDGRAPPGSDPRRHRLRDLDGARPGLGSTAPAGRLLHLPAELRHANRQQHCSADVWGQVPYVRRIRNGARRDRSRERPCPQGHSRPGAPRRSASRGGSSGDILHRQHRSSSAREGARHIPSAVGGRVYVRPPVADLLGLVAPGSHRRVSVRRCRGQGSVADQRRRDAAARLPRVALVSLHDRHLRVSVSRGMCTGAGAAHRHQDGMPSRCVDDRNRATRPGPRWSGFTVRRKCGTLGLPSE